MPQPLTETSFDVQIQTAFASDNVPKIYANGFISARTNSDVFVVLQLNGQPISVLNLSYSSAKTLAQDLQKAIQDLENEMGRQILTIHEINEKTKLP
jgi:hypothetical protein